MEARQSREDRSSASRGTSSGGDAPRAGTLDREGPRQMTVTLDEDDARRLEAARTRFLEKLAGADEAAAEALADVVTQEGFAAYLLRRVIDRMDGGR